MLAALAGLPAAAVDGRLVSWREPIVDERLEDGSRLTGGDGRALGDPDGERDVDAMAGISKPPRLQLHETVWAGSMAVCGRTITPSKTPASSRAHAQSG